MINLLPLLISPKAKGIASLASAALMMVMPDEVDHILEGLLGLFGISKIAIGEKEKENE